MLVRQNSDIAVIVSRRSWRKIRREEIRDEPSFDERSPVNNVLKYDLKASIDVMLVLTLIEFIK